jgi:hypothetical protein
LKPDSWGSPLFQEQKYQEIPVKKRIRNNNNNNNAPCGRNPSNTDVILHSSDTGEKMGVPWGST